MFDVSVTMDGLKQRRPIFHSEADFQHEFAWEMRSCGLATDIRIERPVRVLDKQYNVDILAKHGREWIAIELKYWKKQFNAVVGGEEFVLNNRSTQDISRYDFWKESKESNGCCVRDQIG